MVSAVGRCRAAVLSAPVARGAVDDGAGAGVGDEEAHAAVQASEIIATARWHWAA
jgi:hypothetical protein